MCVLRPGLIFFNFYPFDVVGHGSEAQLQMDDNLNKLTWQDEG